jgi:hypothetical protein
VSKSLFFLFLLAFLATAASLHSGGSWLGEVGRALRLEARADFTSIGEDLHTIRTQAERAPGAFQSLQRDLRRRARMVEADAAADARRAGERASTVVKTTQDHKSGAL